MKKIYELKGCPWCGGVARIIKAGYSTAGKQFPAYYIVAKCNNKCPVSTASKCYMTAAKAATAWNKREA